jgi:hypothetical protein
LPLFGACEQLISGSLLPGSSVLAKLVGLFSMESEVFSELRVEGSLSREFTMFLKPVSAYE